MKRFPVILLCGLIAAIVFAGGCDRALTKAELLPGSALSENQPGPVIRSPTVDGEAITAHGQAGLDVTNVDDAGVHNGSTQPKTALSAPLGPLGRLIALSPGDTAFDELAVKFNPDGSVNEFVIKGFDTSLSDPINAFDDQVANLLASVSHLGTEQKIERIERAKVRGEVAASVADAAINAIIKGVAPTP